jgi:hypothetical protein
MAVYSVESVKGQDHVQTVYRGKDNPIEVVLKLDGADFDYSAAKRIRVKVGQVEFDSDSDPAAFDRTESAIGLLKIFIGDQPGIPAQACNVKVEIVDAADRNLYFGHVRVRIDDPGM